MTLPAGRYFERADVHYEAARAATVWNARLPDRFPDLIVQACDVADVVAALRHAKERGLKVGVRSGGHSWAANHVRDGGLLLDVSRLDALANEAKPAEVIPFVADLARVSASRASGETIVGRIDRGATLIHNAGLWPSTREMPCPTAVRSPSARFACRSTPRPRRSTERPSSADLPAPSRIDPSTNL